MSRSDSQTTPTFGLIAKGLHWGFVGLFLYGVIRQVDDVGQLEDGVKLKFEIMFASVFLLLLVLRFFYMRFTLATALPSNTPAWQKIAAKSVHYAMYFSFAGIAVTGLIIAGLFSIGLKQGLLMSAAIGLHEFTLNLSYLLIGIHITAAVYHRFKGDGIWDAMVPFWKERR